MSGGVRFTGGSLILAAQGGVHLVRRAQEGDREVSGGVRFTGGALKQSCAASERRWRALRYERGRALHGGRAEAVMRRVREALEGAEI